jgi:hypothetical protein
MANLVHNERVKLRATGTANVGTAFIVAGLVAPLVTGRFSLSWGTLLDVVWVAIGFGFRRWASRILGELRDDIP